MPSDDIDRASEPNPYLSLQADAYSGHAALYENRRHRRSRMLGPLPPRLLEIAKSQSKPGLAAQALQWIAQLYAIESRIQEHTPDLKYAARQTEALPLLARFRRWLEGNVIGLPSQAPLAKAFGYALRHWQALVRYTENGILLPDKRHPDIYGQSLE